MVASRYFLVYLQRMKADGKLLRRRRLELGFSLRAVSDRTGLDPSNLSKLERGCIGAHPGTLKTLADLYSLSMEQVLPELHDTDAAA